MAMALARAPVPLVRLARLVCALGALLGPAPADAWVRSGHEQINRIAEGLLKGKRRDQVRSMLKQDLFEAGGWELAMTGKYPQTDVLHWHHQSPEWTCNAGIGDSTKHIQCDGHGAEQGSLFCALEFFFDQFSHEKLLENYPAPKEKINTPKELLVLGKVPKQELSAANYLRWLVVLLGDLHQPLHWLRGSHDYGKKIQVSYKGSRRHLQDFWEEYLPKNAKLPEANTLEHEFQERAMNWDYQTPPELFRVWAREAAEMACQIYGMMEVNHADGSRNIDSNYELSEEMYQKWVTLWQTTATKAGERIAFIMQNVLEHRKHHHGHKEGRGHLHRRVSWVNNLATNAAIAAVVVPSLLLLFRWHSKYPGLGATGLASLLSKDSQAKV